MQSHHLLLLPADGGEPVTAFEELRFIFIFNRATLHDGLDPQHWLGNLSFGLASPNGDDPLVFLSVRDEVGDIIFGVEP